MCFIRAGIVIIPLFLGLVIFNKASLFIVLGFLALALFYALFRDLNHWLLILALPALALGEVLYIPVTSDWVYEARVSEILFAFAGAVFFFDLYFRNEWGRLRLDKTGLLLFAYLLWSLAAFSKIIDFRLFVFGLKAIAYGWLGYILAINLITDKERQNAFLFGLVAAALALSGQLFYKFYELGFSSRFFFERNLITTPVGPLATVSAVLAFLAPVVIGLYFHLGKDSKAKPFALIAAGIVYLAVFLSLGKGAILSLGLGSLIVFWRAPQRRVLFLLAGAWGFILGFYFFTPYLLGLFERIKTTFTDVNTDFRLREYTTAWSVIRDNYLMGVGPGQQIHLFKKLMNLETGNLVNNLFLQSLIDAGAVGLALVVGLALTWAGKVKDLLGKMAPQPAPSGTMEPSSINMLSVGLAGALVAAFVNGLVEVTFYALPYALVFWPVVGSIRNFDK